MGWKKQFWKKYGMKDNGEGEGYWMGQMGKYGEEGESF